ncbi:hypothetical protein CCR75_009681 [Bremia lactucae]|uniref:Uncharacterized protein n=1 Tax=Bremia lactucae TaxID=4779 RepID=A0A976FJC1_BRELC|nr:hypothetical protein CCR75_009681 [Bremia lactucae]
MHSRLRNVNFYFTSIAGVERDVLLNRSARDLRTELGESTIGMVAKSLRSEMNEAIARDDVTSDEIIDLFTVAQKTHVIPVMLDAFAFLEAKFPSQINFAVYGEVFRILQRKNNCERLIEIYLTAKTRFHLVPEMIYRFGIVGYLQNNDMDSAIRTWQELIDAGHETTNEIASQLMLAYARKGNVEKVKELYEAVDPQIGYWHESCVDRVILSMGIIEEPAKAFEFYGNSSMKLSGGTLIALLSVCTNNNCKQQATDILANRKKFDLHLNARGYNRIMVTLEFLGRNNEIKDVLNEMIDNNVRFDTKTNAIIERNAEFLEETNFVADFSKSRAAGYTLSPRIRELLAQGKNSDAAEMVDSAVTLLKNSDKFDNKISECAAMIVNPSVAKDAVQAYIRTNQHDKVAALVQGFSVVPGKYAYALAEVITHYAKQSNKVADEICYAASKAMLFQRAQIFRVDDTLKRFCRFRDTEAALKLFHQVLESYIDKDALDEIEDDIKQSKRHYVNFNVGKVITLILQALVENDRLADAFDSMNKLESCGLKVTQGNYVTLLSSIRKHLRVPNNDRKDQKVLYDINSAQTVLKDLKARSLQVNRAIVGYLCPAYVEATKQQRLELLEAFAEARNDPTDNYILPHSCYETLLNFMAQEGSIEELTDIYEEAVASLTNEENRGVPRGWVTIFVIKLVREGHIDEADQLTRRMPEKCGNYSYKAVMSVLRGALEARKLNVVDGMIALMEDRAFVVKMSDAYDLVHLARKTDLSSKVLNIIRLFESSNLKVVAVEENGKGNLEEAFYRRQRHDAHALRKVKTMYTVALKMCEKDGLWKQALVLRDQMASLLGQEAVDVITTSSPGRLKIRKEKESDYE